MASYRESHLGKSEQYDRDLNESAFDAFMALREAQFLQEYLPKLFPDGIPAYLDFACGTGRITAVAEEFAKHSMGVDVSESMQSIAKQKCAKTTFYLQDICVQPLQVAPVNLVTAFRFFGNAEDELRVAALKAISLQLARGGYLIINNHRNPSCAYIQIETLRGGTDPADLKPSKLHEMLKNNGFSILTQFGIGWWFIHRRLNTAEVFKSALVALVEPVSRLPYMHRYCPDYIVVARKEI